PNHPGSRGASSGDVPEGGAGSGVSRRRLVTVRPERPGTPPGRHYDLSARSIAARIGRKCPRRKRGPRPKTATVVRREARVSRWRRKASRWMPGLPRQTRRGAFDAAGPTGAAAPVRLSAHRPPLAGWTKLQDPGADAPRERERLVGTTKCDYLIGSFGWRNVLRCSPVSGALRNLYVTASAMIASRPEIWSGRAFCLRMKSSRVRRATLSDTPAHLA